MHRKGRLASALFAAMCLGGITTLLSQADFSSPPPRGSGEARRTALDPPQEATRNFGDLVPMSLRKGAQLQAEKATGSDRVSRRILRLR